MKVVALFALISSAGVAAAQPVWTSESRSISFSSSASSDSDGGTVFSSGDLGLFDSSREASSSGSCGESGSSSAGASAMQNSEFGVTTLLASGSVSCTANDSSSEEPCGAGAIASSEGVAEFSITQECRYFLVFDLRAFDGRSHVRIWDLGTGADIERFQPGFGGQTSSGATGVLQPGDYAISWGCDAFANTSGFAGMAGSYEISLELYDPRPPCIGDFNQDGGADGGDVEVFFYYWELGELAADTNRDGGVDSLDVETFFLLWENGGCEP